MSTFCRKGHHFTVNGKNYDLMVIYFCLKYVYVVMPCATKMLNSLICSQELRRCSYKMCLKSRQNAGRDIWCGKYFSRGYAVRFLQTPVSLENP